jgi:transcriptional regulator with XRE-family HTH domain
MEKPTRPPTAKQTFSQNIGLVRRVKNLSQETIGEMAELHRTYIGQIERGEVSPTLDAAERLAQALGVQLWEVLHPNFSVDALIDRDRK